MREYKKQLLTSVPLLVIGIAAIGFVSVSIVKEHNRTRKIDVEIAKQEETASKIARENDLLKKTISYLESEEAQKFGAQKLGYQEDDQHVAVVKDVAKAQETLEQQIKRESETESVAFAEEAHWRVWWREFF